MILKVKLPMKRNNPFKIIMLNTKLLTLNNSKSGEITYKLLNKKKLIKNLLLKLKPNLRELD